MMTEYKAKLLESIDELYKTEVFSQKVMSVFGATKCLIFQEEKLEKEIEHLKETMVLLLKALVGQPIYWASPNWKMETHTIRDVEYRVVDSDFFDDEETKYKGKAYICIEVDKSGYYLADFIGKNLFFDKEEAMNHARKEVN